MKVLFLDTNLFLQCKDLEQLPWDGLVNEEIVLLIPQSVRDEIDRLKQDGNSRRAKRSRKASSFFREIILSGDSEVTIRNSNPTVRISFTPVLKPKIKIDLPEFLDLSRADDRIIAEAFSFRNAYPDDEVVILTNDTNLALTSKRSDLPFLLIPDDWLLPPESDPRDKKIVELENRVKILEKSLPEIEIKVFNSEGSPIESLDIEIIHYNELEEFELKELVTMVEAANPRVTDFDSGLRYYDRMALGLGHVYEPPSKEIVKKYLNEQYPNWLIELEEYFKSLAFKFALPYRYIKTSFVINNVGKAPANDVTIEFHTYNGLRFSPPGKELIKKPEPRFVITLPKAPKAPQGRIINKHIAFASTLAQINPGSFIHDDALSRIRDFTFTHPTIPRKKKDFYWRDSKPVDYQDEWVFECEEFLHHRDPEPFDVTVFVHPNLKTDMTSQIESRVFVKNLPEPIVFRLPIRVKFKEEDLFQTVKKLTERVLGFSRPNEVSRTTTEQDND